MGVFSSLDGDRMGDTGMTGLQWAIRDAHRLIGQRPEGFPAVCSQFNPDSNRHHCHDCDAGEWQHVMKILVDYVQGKG